MFKSYLITETEWGLPTVELALNQEKNLRAILDNAFSGIAVMEDYIYDIGAPTAEALFLDGTAITGVEMRAASICIQGTPACVHDVNYIQSKEPMSLDGVSMLFGLSGLHPLSALFSTSQFVIGHSLLTF